MSKITQFLEFYFFQVGSSLLFKFRGYGIDNSTGSRQLTWVDVSTDVWTDHQIQLSESTWKYVSIVYSTYNEFARIQAIGNGNSEKTSENIYNHTGGGTHVFAFAFGNIRFGNSFAGDMPFSGSIACITFKGQSLTMSSFMGLEPQCDPASWGDTSNLGTCNIHSVIRRGLIYSSNIIADSYISLM